MDAGTQTRTTVRGRAPIDLGTVVSRLRLSVPLLQRTLFDQQLRQLVLSSLVAQSVQDGSGIVLPDRAPVQLVSEPVFQQYQDAMAGLNANNMQEVQARLWELGVGPDRFVCLVAWRQVQ